MFDWIGNDTIALVFLGVIAIAGVFLNQENVVVGALGAISGYIGSKALNK